MRSIIRPFFILALTFASFSANALVFSHGTGTFTSGNGGISTASAFDRAEFSFSAMVADTITLANFESGIAHNGASGHGVGGELTTLQVYDGSSWVSVFSDDPGSADAALSTTFASPITFASMTISGLRLDGGSTGYHFHYVNSDMTYSITAAIPEPETYAMLLAGLGLLGFMAKRRKQKEATRA